MILLHRLIALSYVRATPGRRLLPRDRQSLPECRTLQSPQRRLQLWIDRYHNVRLLLSQLTKRSIDRCLIVTQIPVSIQPPLPNCRRRPLCSLLTLRERLAKAVARRQRLYLDKPAKLSLLAAQQRQEEEKSPRRISMWLLVSRRSVQTRILPSSTEALSRLVRGK